MKFVIFVEGHTEKIALPNFFKRWLDPKLDQRVGIQVVRFDGWPELVKDSPDKAAMHLEKRDVIAVIALLDLYGPTIYPDHIETATARYEWAKKDIEEKVNTKIGNSGIFRQVFAVHETEAWLFSDPNIFPNNIQRAFPGKTSSPENINFNEPPSKLLERLYKTKMKRTYKKVTHGKELFGKLDPQIAYNKCPRLKELLDEMLRLAQNASL